MSAVSGLRSATEAVSGTGTAATSQGSVAGGLESGHDPLLIGRNPGAGDDGGHGVVGRDRLQRAVGRGDWRTHGAHVGIADRKRGFEGGLEILRRFIGGRGDVPCFEQAPVGIVRGDTPYHRGRDCASQRDEWERAFSHSVSPRQTYRGT